MRDARTTTNEHHPPVGLSEDAPLRALVVDDDPDIRGLLQLRLQTRGYLVETAWNGIDALERLETFSADLMLLDVSMPEMGGLEVLERVRVDGRDMAIVMTTAFGSEQIAVEALRLGADDYLRKPFDPPELRAILDRTVRRLLLERQNAELRRQLDAELSRAAETQANLLPDSMPNIPGWDVAARCIPARQVGGDFYDWQMTTTGSLAITLADVMGKGMPAALMMATVRSALRSVVTDYGPADAISRVDTALARDLDRSGSFVTLFHAQLDPTTGQLTYVDAGHGHVLLLRRGAPLALPRKSLPLGILPGSSTDEAVTQIAEGDALIVYSDGLIDARPDLHLTPAAIAREIADTDDAASITDRLTALVDGGGALTDDLTLLVLRRCWEGRA